MTQPKETLPLTEQDSHYRHLEQQSVTQLLRWMNAEDRKVPEAVGRAVPQIAALVEAVVEKMQAGGRLFYLGSGTAGRLGIVDASECPPTFGVPHHRVVGLIAGGDAAIRKAQEFAEDDVHQGWKDLQAHSVSAADVVVGISASGTTPYTVGALQHCQAHGIITGCITSNPDTPLAAFADYPIEVITGPEFVTGSTRLKAGTAQKLVLNMISTATMIRLGRVQDNKMVDMQLTNQKLIRRAVRLITALYPQVSPDEAQKLVRRTGSVRKTLEYLKQHLSAPSSSR